MAGYPTTIWIVCIFTTSSWMLNSNRNIVKMNRNHNLFGVMKFFFTLLLSLCTWYLNSKSSQINSKPNFLAWFCKSTLQVVQQILHCLIFRYEKVNDSRIITAKVKKCTPARLYTSPNPLKYTWLMSIRIYLVIIWRQSMLLFLLNFQWFAYFSTDCRRKHCSSTFRSENQNKIIYIQGSIRRH